MTISLTQPDTNQPVAEGSVTIFVESHTIVRRIFGGCSEVRRFNITTPRVTIFVTISVTGNEEARKERMITHEQLVDEVCVTTCSCSVRQYSVPQSISTASIPVVTSGFYCCLVTLCEESLASSLVINKHDFCELERKATAK